MTDDSETTQRVHVPHPGSRLDATTQAAAAAQPAVTVVSELATQDPAFPAVPVTVEAIRPASHASYSTVTVPPSGGLVVGVAQLLPYDSLRQRAWILPIDGPVVIAASKEEAQDPANGTATFPGGFFAPPGGYPVGHQGVVWAANPSATAVRVSVAIETSAGR